MALDPRLTPARPDLASEALQGTVDAARFVRPGRRYVTAPILNLRTAPDSTPLATQLIHGESFDVLEESDGLAWGQSVTDGYVGYVQADCLAKAGPAPSRVVSALFAPVYPSAAFKAIPVAFLPWQSRVASSGEGDFLRVPEGHVCAQHLMPVSGDWVDQAARLLGVPYLWGGRSPMGLDCSALVQLGLSAVGVGCPRDSDMQMDGLGEALSKGETRRRGDLVFWKGHVGILEDAETLLHANVFHMAVAREPLAEACARILARGGGPVLMYKRL